MTADLPADHSDGAADSSVDVTTRIVDAVAGLCTGDAMTWTSWWHRLNDLPPRRSLRLRQAHTDARDKHATSVPTPYLHATSPSAVDPAGPTDDAEWFTVAVRHHLGQALDGSDTDEDVWHELARLRADDADSVRGRLGTVFALENVAAGLAPPASGHDNVHWFDDHACVRGVAAGLLRPGDPGAAADLAADDATWTHSGDGVWGSRAVAAMLAALVTGVDTDRAIEAAMAELPHGSWIRAVVDECAAAAADATSTLGLAAALESDVVDHVYAYANQAPETLGLLVAHLQVAHGGTDLLLGAMAHPKHADGLVPLAGAVAGAAFGGLGRDLDDLGVLRGVTVAALEGVTVRDLADTIVTAATTARAAGQPAGAGA